MTKVNCDKMNCIFNTNFECTKEEVIMAMRQCLDYKKRQCSEL